MALTHPKLGITKDMLAGKVLPFLITISVDNGLSLQQVKCSSMAQKSIISNKYSNLGCMTEVSQQKSVVGAKTQQLKIGNVKVCTLCILCFQNTHGCLT